MDSEVFKFNKTYEERLDNLNTILLDTDDNSALPQILRIWSNYLELSIEPLGWKALWYISRRCCNELKITFPAIVGVTVSFIFVLLYTSVHVKLNIRISGRIHRI